MTRTSKIKNVLDTSKHSTCTDELPQARRKKPSSTNKKKTPSSIMIDDCDSPSIRIVNDENEDTTNSLSISITEKHQTKRHPISDDKTLSSFVDSLSSFNVTAGCPIPSTIDLNSVAYCSIFLTTIKFDDGNVLPVKEKKIDLINMARRCLQNVSLKDLETSADHPIANLNVAIDCLRSVNITLISTHSSGEAKVQAVFERVKQLYFHSISIAENLFHEFYKSLQQQDNVKTSGELLKNMISVMQCCLWAYQGLGHLIRHTWKLSWGTVENDGGYHSYSLFPVPHSPIPKRKRSAAQNETSLPWADVKSVLRNVLSVSSMVKALHGATWKNERQVEGSRPMADDHSQNQSQDWDLYGTPHIGPLSRNDHHGTLLLPSFRHVVCNELIPWLIHALSDDDLDNETITEVSNYCHRGYRILWDASKEIECSHSKDRFRAMRLRLQREALMILCLYQNEGQLSSNHILFMVKSLDQVCKLANQSSFAYFHGRGRVVDDELVNFHRNVGDAVDHVVQHYSAPSMEYVEYCARRAIHFSVDNIVSRSVLGSGWCFPPDQVEGGTNLITRSLHLVQVTLSVTGTMASSRMSETVVDHVVSGFLEYVEKLGGFSRLESELLFIYRLLTILEIADGSPQRFNHLPIDHLQALQSILCKIFLPLIKALRDQRGRLRDFPELDSFHILSINLLLKTIHVLEPRRDFNLSDAYIRLVADWLSPDDQMAKHTYIKLLEYSAKTVYNVGKMRMSTESDTNCLFPFVTGIELFTLCFNETKSLDYKISDKYAHLGKLFSAYKMVKEATITTALSITHLVKELSVSDEYSECTFYASEILLFIDDHLIHQNPVLFTSIWPQASSEKCQMLVSKLVMLLRDDRQWSTSKVDSCISPLSDTGWYLIKHLQHVYDGSTNFVKRLIRKSILGAVDRRNSNAHSMLKDVMRSFIWELARSLDFKTDLTTMKINFQGVFDEVISFYDSHDDPVSCLEFNALAAVALYSDNQKKSYAMHFLSEALRRCHAMRDIGVHESAYILALDICLWSLSIDDGVSTCSTTSNDFPLLNPPPPRKVVDSIARDIYFCDDKFVTIFREETNLDDTIACAAITLLTKASLILEYEGYSARSPLKCLNMIPSKWGKRSKFLLARYVHGRILLGGQLQDMMEQGELPHQSFADEVIADLSCNLGHFRSLVPRDNVEGECVQLCSDILSLSFTLAAMAVGPPKQGFSTSAPKLESLVQRLSEADMGDIDRFNKWPSLAFRFVCKLVISLCYEFLYRHYERTGNFLRALKYLRISCSESQNLLNILSRQVGPFSTPLSDFFRIYQSKAFYMYIGSRVGTELSEMASLYTQLGNPSKSLRYTLWAAETIGALSGDFRLSSRASVQDTLHGLSINHPRTYRQRQCVRAVFESFLLSSPYSKVNISLLGAIELHFHRSDENQFQYEEKYYDLRIFSWLREMVKDFIALDDIFTRNRALIYDKTLFNHRALSMILCTQDKQTNGRGYIEFPSLEGLNHLVHQLKHDQYCIDPLFWEVTTRVGVKLYDSYHVVANECLLELFRHASSATNGSNHVKALSFYYLGLSTLEQARSTGELYQLWQGYCNDRMRIFRGYPSTQSHQHICKAREYFLHASFFAGPASSSLSRRIMRCIALVTGPAVTDIRGYSASEILHSSIGSSARIQASRAYFCSDQYDSLFTAFDIPLYEEENRQRAFDELYSIGLRVLPSSWSFLSISMCPSGELLFATIRRPNESWVASPFICETVCIFPDMVRDGFDIVRDILEPFNHLMERSCSHLSVSKDNKNTTKEEWWEEREMLDIELKTLLEKMDEMLLSHSCVKEILAPICTPDESYEENDLRQVSGNLSLKFEALCTIDCTDKQVEGKKFQTQSDRKSSSCKQRTLFLVLDEYFLSLPIENLFTFNELTVCRIPSMPFAIARCYAEYDGKPQAPYVDLSKTTYVLDPESNLVETRDRMKEFFDRLTMDNGWDWNAFIGQIPNDEVIEDTLQTENSLYLFCGHGGGESFYPRSKFDRIFLEREKNRTKGKNISPICESTLILMGCSSGRLSSVNADEEEYAPLRDYHYEPDGAIISYLCAGAPCIVANLWDVTDRDIDRYLKELISQFASMPDDECVTNLATCVARARTACKMRYIVGCAPVIYGVPVITANNQMKLN